jgi:hypothetical protein
LPAAQVAAQKTPGILGAYAQGTVGSVGTVLNQKVAVQNTLTNLVGAKPDSFDYVPKTTAEKVGGYVAQGTELVAVAVVAPEILPISTPAIIGAGVLNIGLNLGINRVVTGKFDTNPTNILNQAIIGEGFAVAGVGLLKGVTSVAQTSIPVVSRAAVFMAGTPLGRVSTFTGFGAAVGYVTTGSPLGAGEGALMGLGFSSAGEYLGTPILAKIRSVLPESMGGVPMLSEGEMISGKTGEPVKTWVSDPIDELGGKQIRVIADVTANPVGVNGVTVENMANEYVGKDVPTAHATLNSSSFDLKAGGETLLKGFPSEGAGFRASQELFHFYSAPGNDQYVNIYGGYTGIANEYEENPIPRLVLGGKPTVLVTVDTPISPEFSPLIGESQEDYLSRTSLLSGKTGIAQETMLGKSTERQFITPASYERDGEQLPGSKFVSEGKIGSFQIKEYQGRFQDTPILRDLTARYTTLKIIKGTYEPTNNTFLKSKGAVLNVAKYNEEYVPTRNISSFSSRASTIGFGLFSIPKLKVSQGLTNSITSRSISKPNLSMYDLIISNPSKNISNQSYPSSPSTLSYPSNPSFPSQPSNGSPPNYPPSTPPPPPPTSSQPKYKSKNNGLTFQTPMSPLEIKIRSKGRLNPSGLDSRKRLYPILTAQEFLGKGEPTGKLNSAQKNLVSSQKILGLKTRRSKR